MQIYKYANKINIRNIAALAHYNIYTLVINTTQSLF